MTHRDRDATPEIEELRTRLAEAEEMLAAIRNGAVDALVVQGPDGTQVFSLVGADQTYRVLVEQMSEGTTTVTRDGVILYSNHAAADMLRVPLDRLIGRHVAEVLGQETWEVFKPMLRDAFAGGTHLGREMMFRRPDGTELPVLVSLRRLDIYPDAVVSVVTADLTAQKASEAALRRSQAELEARVTQLRLLAAELTHAEQRERRRLARILHDHLQQILVSVKLQAGSIRRRTREPGTSKAAQEMEALLGEALDASRSLTLELSPPLLHERGLVPTLEWLARWMGEKHKIAVHTSLEPGAEPAAEDVRVFLYHAARELLLNVRKHAGADQATLSLWSLPDGRLRLEVADEGAGFDTSIRRSDASSGFGLFSIRERLAPLGGTLEVASEPGKGTRVTLIAPRGKSPRVEELEATCKELGMEAGPPSRPSLPPARRLIRVLLVDDHEVVRRGIAAMLKAEPDVELVGEAMDGIEAVDLTGALRPDVVIMDVTMPRLDGIEATRRVIAAEPRTRVIGLSMHESDDVARAMRAAGATDYVEKGGSPEELVAAIRRACPV